MNGSRAHLSRLNGSHRNTRYRFLMSDELALTIVFEPGEDGWVIATIPEVRGVFSQGRTREEARANVIDALRLMLSPEPTGRR